MHATATHCRLPKFDTIVRVTRCATFIAMLLAPSAARAQSQSRDATATNAPANAQRLAHESTRPPPRSGATLGFFATAGYLASPGERGAVLTAGLRLGVGRFFASSFDLGYGVIGSSTDVQDRWWLMPSVAFVIPAGRARVDIGAGLGLGATSGYVDLPAYVAHPFTPVWAYQLVPAARAHVEASFSLTHAFDLIGRVEVASLWLDAPGGFRAGNPQPRTSDTSWIVLSVGFRYRLL